ncbi:DUF2939 domain-containing protein [Hymenobacter metallilatus]|uniref:DUF2939 domain-containing protein n=1 Tax=Hymenobacter metallilatus TaxID=2493666 RepID=A0A3R9UQ44_9BACT|nr:DUF2939 domain-containing protein [Hymenobacter metallilatus]RSK37645.1 DUF2939 domain-containing protein [Hymenobacter metallilatus]
MKRTILLLLVLALAGGAYLYYRHLSTGPEYSLMQAYKAVTQHDAAAFERYVDVSSVTGSLVDQVAEQGSALGVLNPGGFAMKGALRLLKPQLARAARQEVKRYVETGSATAAADASSTQMMNVSILGLADKVVGKNSSFKGVKYSREEGEQAFIGLEFTQPRYDTTLVLEVKMQNRGDHWQATEITNISEILQHVARMEKQHLLGK